MYCTHRPNVESITVTTEICFSICGIEKIKYQTYS